VGDAGSSQLLEESNLPILTYIPSDACRSLVPVTCQTSVEGCFVRQRAGGHLNDPNNPSRQYYEGIPPALGSGRIGLYAGGWIRLDRPGNMYTQVNLILTGPNNPTTWSIEYCYIPSSITGPEKYRRYFLVPCCAFIFSVKTISMTLHDFTNQKMPPTLVPHPPGKAPRSRSSGGCLQSLLGSVPICRMPNGYLMRL
jgi:hypothetical protein